MPIDWTAVVEPPTPTAESDVLTWANHLAYVRMMDERKRFDAQQAISEASTAAQNARAVAEQAVAKAGADQAAANLVHAEALKAMAEAMGKEVVHGVSEATLLSAIEVVAKRE